MYLSKVEIDLARIQTNYHRLAEAFPNRVLAPVIKSDAYGHGAAQVASALVAAGCGHLCVFSVGEARFLRENGIGARVWVLGGVAPGEEPEMLLSGSNTAYALWSREQLARLDAFAQAHRRIFDCHLTIETGMSRLGFFPSEIPGVLDGLSRAAGLRLCGAFSHLASADNPDSPQTALQVRRFREVVAMLPSGCDEVHLCATPGMMAGAAPEYKYLRPGFAIYGYGHDDRMPQLHFEPSMSFKSIVLSVKDIQDGEHVSYRGLYRVDGGTCRIAVVPVGYANGYPRCLGNRAEVLVRGRRAPIRGRICMGMMMVDVSRIDGVLPGDEVVLLGAQGNDAITGEELAALAGTIPYEILCALGKEPNRVFIPALPQSGGGQ